MKNSTKKVLRLGLGFITCLGASAALAACNKSKNDPNTFYISIINKGYGNAWIETMIKKFIATNDKYKDFKYNIINSYDDEATKTTVESGAKYCNYDLVFHGGGSNLISSQYLADLSPVYNMAYKGSTVKENMDESVVSNFERTDKESGATYYNCIPWATGGSGILVDYDLVKEKLGSNWETEYPNRTTEEFLDFIEALDNEETQAFVFVTNRDYYSPLYEAWWAQYEGMEGVEKYFKAQYTDIQGDVKEGPEAFIQDGTLQALKVMEKIFKNQSYVGTAYSNWNTMQAAYMEKKSAMIVNGPWMEYEMTGKAKSKSIDMRYIKTPMLSALGAKLGISQYEITTGKESSDKNINITDETKFIEVIDYVDGKITTKPSGVTDDQINTIAKARKMVVNQMDYSDSCIPNYSSKKDAAIDFLKWMYSLEGQKEYVAATNGLFLPIKNTLYEDGEVTLSNYAKSHKDLTKDASFVFGNMKWKFSKAGLKAFSARNVAPVEYLLTGKSGCTFDGMTLDSAYNIYQYNTKYYQKGSNWDLLKRAAE